jgi:hypothetical protein
MLMPEPNNVSKLMNNDTKLVTILADGNRLSTIAPFTHK